MRRVIAVALGLAVGVFLAVAALAIAGRAVPQRYPYGPPIGPALARDTGVGEMLVVVVGGVYPTRAEALTANSGMSFGDLQGYYVVRVARFRGLRAQLGVARGHALLSAFRTERGAREFAALAGRFGHPAVVVANRVRSLGGRYAGLGQEEDPSGTGPLIEPIPASLP